MRYFVRLDLAVLVLSSDPRASTMDVAEKFEENSPLLVANGSRKVNRNWFRNVTVEPVAFLLSFGWSLSGRNLRLFINIYLIRCLL